MRTSVAIARRHDGMPIYRKFWAVWRPFFTVNKDKSKAWGWLVLMMILLIFESGTLVAFSYTQKDFSTAMSAKDQEGFYRGTRQYMMILLAAGPLFAFSRFVQGKLGLDWRRWLTQHICGLYFGNRAFYALKIGDLSGVEVVSTDDAGGPEKRSGKTNREEQGGGIDNPVSAVDNPDQRIGEDIASFTTNCISMLVVFVGSVLKIGSFVGVLLSISPQLTAFVVLYSLAGTFLTTFMFGARLKHLIFEEAKREANFRFGLVRVREYAEEIAFYRGERGEETSVKGLLERVIDNTHHKLWCEAQLATFSNSFMWLTAVLPYLVVAQRYFAGEIEFGAIAQTAMAFRVIQNALSVIVTKIRTLASLASEVDRLHFLIVCMEGMVPTEARGFITGDDSSSPKSKPSEGSQVLAGDEGFVKVPLDNRYLREDDLDAENKSSVSVLGDENCVDLRLLGGGEETRGAGLGSGSKDNSGGTRGSGRISMTTLTAQAEKGKTVLKIEDMTILTPDRRETICQGLSFQVLKGQSLLVFGPSGCGKSSLLRAISGLWSAGKGNVLRYADDCTVYIPQVKLVLPLIIHPWPWPCGHPAVERCQAGMMTCHQQKPYLKLGSLKAQMVYPLSEDNSTLSSASLETILEDVQLGFLCARSGGLDTIRDWQDELSLGEQQRLAFSRLLTNTPSMVFLDEATSALDEANESRLYSLLQAIGVDAYVSVGHRASLFRYHTHVLRGQGDGQWFFHTMEEFLNEHYSHPPAAL